ncbi:MAG TPA: hypothetical protein VER03_10140, partial [Bryobacteraceae bacterium]|nr:hypothetical protein [Bryobacteraceae bacterium]
MMNRKVIGGAFAAAVMALGVSAADAAVVILESFDTNEGRFAQDPDFSGSNAGLTTTGPGVGPSTADRTTTDPERGTGAQLLALVHDPSATFTGFQVRFLAGGGSSGATNPTFDANGFIGLFVKSDQSLQIGFLIDDGTTIERTQLFSYTGGTGYQLAQFNLDATDFVRFNGTGGTAALDAATVN